MSGVPSAAPSDASERLSVKIRSAERFDTLSPKELGRLLELSSGINALHDLDEILAQVVAAARSLLGTDMSTVLIVDEDGDRLDVAAAEGVDGEIARGLSTPIGENLAGRVAETGKPLRCCDVPADSRSRLPAVREAGITSAMLSPLEHHGEMIGVLAVETIDRRRFSAREQRLLQLLANQAATAIEKARLYSAEHAHVEELRSLVERVNNQYQLMSRSREAHDRLTRVALAGLGLDTLARSTAEIAGVPIAVVNQFGFVMHAASPTDDIDVEALWEQCRANARFEERIESLRQDAGLIEASCVDETGAWRMVPAVAAGEALGFVVALEGAPLGEVETTVLEQAAGIVATELMRERSIAEAEARVHGDILRSLLIGNGDTPNVRERAALLGHDLGAPQCVVVISPAESAEKLDDPVLTSAGSWASAQAGLRGIIADVDGYTVALLSSSDRTLSRDSAVSWVSSFRKRLGALGYLETVRIGVSPVTADPPEIKSAHAYAKQALQVSELDDGGDAAFFEEVELLATLVSAVDRELLRRFVHRCVGKLQEYDERRDSSLARTLEVYLDHSGVARHAAQALYLHPHSLRYRLRRIDEIQGIDLTKPMERLMAHLALKLRSVV